ncbi:MAG TPA: MBL fold metallo-hydrolase [Burkholderiales bacterium]|nr:MBL fold metallo-hydrolase [Burkholderiales bacterium]
MVNAAVIAPGLQVIVRDWLDANHVLLTCPDECVLIDTGSTARVERTLSLLRAPSALGERPLTTIVNTHCHSDHMGGNAAIARAFRAAICVPLDAAPVIDAWDTRELLLDYADQEAERFRHTSTIAAGDTLRLGAIEWQALAAPGHDMSALVFYAPEHRVLVSGDALWENGFGLVEPLDRLDERLAAQRATLERVATLDIACVVPGHGTPFTDARNALERAFERLDAYAADPLRLARHCLKAFFVFALLGRERMATADVPPYFERVPCYREYNERFFGIAPGTLARQITGELLRSGAIVERDGFLLAKPQSLSR